MKKIDRLYGTHRGLIRLALAEARFLLGGYRDFQSVEWGDVERLVFVCLGNVCRSPYAHYRAARVTSRVASIGLSAATGTPAHPPARKAAAERGVDLDHHKATSLQDFEPKKGDLFLVMEDRHIAPLRAALRGRLPDFQIALLGLWARPRRALIYDPMGTPDAYFTTCYSVIDSAVDNLMQEWLSAPCTSQQA